MHNVSPLLFIKYLIYILSIMKVQHFLIFLLLQSASYIHAQNSIVFKKYYDDGGYMAIANTEHLYISMLQFLKLDAYGDTLWTRQYGGPINNDSYTDYGTKIRKLRIADI